MAHRGRQSSLKVERLQITLAEAELRHLDIATKLGKFGRNRNEVAARIVANWLEVRLPVEIENYLKRDDLFKEFDRRLSADSEAS